MLKQADEWLYSMKCLLSVKTDEEDRAYTQKRIDLFNWLIEQAEQNKRYREAINSMRLHVHYPEIIKQIYGELESESE